MVDGASYSHYTQNKADGQLKGTAQSRPSNTRPATAAVFRSNLEVYWLSASLFEADTETPPKCWKLRLNARPLLLGCCCQAGNVFLSGWSSWWWLVVITGEPREGVFILSLGQLLESIAAAWPRPDQDTDTGWSVLLCNNNYNYKVWTVWTGNQLQRWRPDRGGVRAGIMLTLQQIVLTAVVCW